MGLDVSHNCWCGSYTAFNNFRREIAHLAGLDLNSYYGLGGTKLWVSAEEEPLVTLLSHSDCEGEIAWEDLSTLIQRLREIEILARACKSTWIEEISQFAEGLETAYEWKQSVEFA
jgi:hypothetical protein